MDTFYLVNDWKNENEKIKFTKKLENIQINLFYRIKSVDKNNRWKKAQDNIQIK